MSEPTTDEAIGEWIAKHVREADRFGDVAAATAAHRAEHGCDAFEGGNGTLLSVLARSAAPRRVLEVGTALGYGTLWLAHGAGPEATVHTIEVDSGHADLAREQFARHGADGIEVMVGNDLDLLARLNQPFGLIVYDAAVPTPAHLAHFARLLEPRGLLVSSNLFLGRYAPDLPGLAAGAAYREALFADPWLTSFAGTKALTIRA